MAKQCILFYEPAPTPWGAGLEGLCRRRGLLLRRVGREDLGRRVGALAQGLRPAGEVPAALPVPEPVVVFCALGSNQMDRMLQGLRELGAGGCLKAALTQTNAQWSFRALYEELVRERGQLG